MIKLKQILTEITKDDKYWHPGVNPVSGLLVIRKTKVDIQILLVKRSEKKNKNRWAIPGGFQDTYSPLGQSFKADKEDIKDAAIRELREETNLDLSAFKNKLIVIGTSEGEHYILSDGQEAWRYVTEHVVLIDDTVNIDNVRAGDDAPEAKWFDIRELNNIKFAYGWDRVVKLGLKRLGIKYD